MNWLFRPGYVVIGLVLGLMASWFSPAIGGSTGAAPSDRVLTGARSTVVGQSDWETCSTTTCDVLLDPVVSLSDTKPSVLPEFAIVVVPAGPDRFVVYTKTGDELLAFDKTGKIVARLGRGRGGATFLRLNNIIPAPNSAVVVHDLRGGVASVVTGDLKVVKQVRTAVGPDLALASGMFVTVSPIRTADRIGMPLHLLDENMAVKVSFGADAAESRSDLQAGLPRKITAGPVNTVWAVAPGRYVFEQWDPATQRRLTTLRAQSSWFEESIQTVNDEKVRPKARILQIAMDSGLLWSVIRVADTNWKPPVGANAERPFSLQEYNQTYDWVIEAVSATSGKVLASRRFETARWGQSASPFVATREISEGVIGERVNVYRMNIKRKDRAVDADLYALAMARGKF